MFQDIGYTINLRVNKHNVYPEHFVAFRIVIALASTRILPIISRGPSVALKLATPQ